MRGVERVTTIPGDLIPRYRIVIGVASLAVQFCMGLSFLAVAPLFPLIRTAYGVDRATVSLLIGVSTLVLALTLVPASVIARRLGSRNSMLIGGLLMATLVFVPLATTFPVFLGLRITFGLGAALTLAT